MKISDIGYRLKPNIGYRLSAAIQPICHPCLLNLGVGDWVDKMELQVLSSYPATSNYIQVDDFQALETIVEKMADIICNSKLGQVEREKCTF